MKDVAGKRQECLTRNSDLAWNFSKFLILDKDYTWASHVIHIGHEATNHT
jgi:glutathione peroxidase-family protein